MSYSQPFRDRPIIGKLKFIRAKVQSLFEKLPEAERTKVARLELLNFELETYHLRANDWADFVTFVRNPPVNSKVLSRLLRHARWKERTYVGSYQCPTSFRWVFVIEEIKLAAYYKVPFHLLKLRRWISRNKLANPMREHGITNGRLKELRAQGELVSYAAEHGIKIPLRRLIWSVSVYL